MASGDTKTQQFLDIAAHGSREVLPARGCCNTRTQDLILDVAERIITEEETRAEADQELQEEIDEIRNNPDVVDIVWTYADLQAYDTQRLTDNDIVRVLADETHDGNSTYYRYDKTNDSWTYIGQSKQYDDFVGTDGTTAGESGLVPAPAATDAGKFLKADGTWDDAGSAVNVVQTIGASTTDVMSQDAATKMVFPTASKGKIGIGTDVVVSPNYACVAIGNYAKTGQQAVSIGSANNDTYRTESTGNYSIAIGANTKAASTDAIALGQNANSSYGYSVAIGRNATTGGTHSVAIGYGAKTTEKGQFDISAGTTGTNGYNSSNYRLLTGLYDPQSDHDAATKGYVDTAVAGAGEGGGIPELTEADYNYPENNPNRIAAWMLDDGIYHFTTGVSVVLDNGSAPFSFGGGILLKNTYISRIEMTLLTDSTKANNRGCFNILSEVVSEYGTVQEDPAYNITSRQTVDRLNDTSIYYPLSANQGKVLNDKITALEARVAALEGN